MSKEIVKEFLGKFASRLIELRGAADNEEYDLCERLANEYCVEELRDIMNWDSYKALKEYASTSTGVDKPAAVDKEDGCNCSISTPCWGGLQGKCGACHGIVEEKKPEKQTLLEFLGSQVADTRPDAWRLTVERISEFLEERGL